jgi:hypothetical protein
MVNSYTDIVSRQAKHIPNTLIPHPTKILIFPSLLLLTEIPPNAHKVGGAFRDEDHLL